MIINYGQWLLLQLYIQQKSENKLTLYRGLLGPLFTVIQHQRCVESRSTQLCQSNLAVELARFEEAQVYPNMAESKSVSQIWSCEPGLITRSNRVCCWLSRAKPDHVISYSSLARVESAQQSSLSHSSKERTQLNTSLSDFVI